MLSDQAQGDMATWMMPSFCTEMGTTDINPRATALPLAFWYPENAYSTSTVVV